MKNIQPYNITNLPAPQVPRSFFTRPGSYQTAFDHGKLIPVFCDVVIPGDTHKMEASVFLRMSPTVRPIFGNIMFDLHFFWVPMRLIFGTWGGSGEYYGIPPYANFFGERLPEDMVNAPVLALPRVTADGSGFTKNSIYDYMGVVPDIPGLSVVSCSFRAYDLVFDDYYRDQNLQDPVSAQRNEADNEPEDFELRTRNAQHDYFSSLLPWPQRGPDVPLPLGDSAPVFGNEYGLYMAGSSTTGALIHDTDTHRLEMSQTAAGLKNTDGPADTAYRDRGIVGLAEKNDVAALDTPPIYDKSGLYADLSEATATTINELRRAIAYQQMYERDARYGTRYPELVRAHYGVQPVDVSHRPEFLGSIRGGVTVHPITQAAPTTSGTPIIGVGGLAGQGTGVQSGHAFTKSFTEHGYIIGILSTRAQRVYQQGVPRHFFYETREEFGFPTLAHLGEQPVYMRELFAGGANPNSVLGYTERYNEFRHYPSMITGAMRRQAGTSLYPWTLGKFFSAEPTSLLDVIQETPDDVDERVQVPSEPHYFVDIWYKIGSSRPLPVYGTPGLRTL